MSQLSINQPQKTMVLIDGKSIFYRGYYALPNLTTKDGRSTGGVYGFTVLALEIINHLKPDYVAVAWDKRGTNIRRRKKIYDRYKANRQKAPDNFYEQIPTLLNLLQSFGWPLYEADDYEADDIMGTLAQQASRQNIHTILISSDLDLLQLIDKNTDVYAIKKGFGQLEKFNPQTFQTKYQIRVDQFLDLKSLKGDSSDNIPGVAGIGQKTAASLLQQYDTLDNIYANLDSLKKSIQKKLSDGRHDAYMSRELAKIWCDAPTPLDLSAMDINNFNRQSLQQNLLDLEFTSLLKRLPDHMRYQTVAVDQPQSANLQEVAIPHSWTNQPIVVVVFDDQVYLCQNETAYCRTDFTTAQTILNNRPIITYDAKKLAKLFLEHSVMPNFVIDFDTKHARFLLNSLQSSLTLDDYLSQQSITINPVNYLSTIISLYHDQIIELSRLDKLSRLAKEIDFPLQIVLAKMEHYG